MRQYLQIYKEFFLISLAEELSFRLNFLLQSLMNISFLGVYFLSSFFIFDHVSLIGLWTKEQFLFFLSFALVIDQIHYLLFSFNFWVFSENIRTGYFDFILLKPVSSFFIVFFKEVAITGILTVILTLPILIHFGLKLELSFWIWLSLPVCLFFALALLLGLEVIISLLNFLTVEGMGVNQMRLQIQQLTRWPDFIYKKNIKWFLFPFLAITSIPVHSMLDRSYWFYFIGMMLGVFILWTLILFWLWPKGTRYYESASS
ncbi:MAG: ABC-2 family transporter protein [Bdellovibrionales bacterium]|nr:ABC-2 family transporter protein [Bdellovibrionales bacterium]